MRYKGEEQSLRSKKRNKEGWEQFGNKSTRSFKENQTKQIIGNQIKDKDGKILKQKKRNYERMKKLLEENKDNKAGKTEANKIQERITTAENRKEITMYGIWKKD